VRILVTHQLQFLRNATKILVLKEGKCIGIGTYEELTKSGINFMSIISDKQKNDKKAVKSENIDTNIALRHLNRAISVTPSIASSFDDGLDIPDDKQVVEEDEPKLKDETKMIGSIDSSVYFEYFKAGAGTFLMTTAILSVVISQALYQGSDLWLTHWWVNLYLKEFFS
jgi:ATP-binding cassette subfamily C (CFTR/MRP) protein 4